MPIKRFTFDLPHSGHFLIGGALMDWNRSNSYPQAAHLYS
jgi:hypothetical protein